MKLIKLHKCELITDFMMDTPKENNDMKKESISSLINNASQNVADDVSHHPFAIDLGIKEIEKRNT